MKKYILIPTCITALFLSCTSVSFSQYNQQLVSITNPQSNADSTFKFSDIMNIKLAYQLDSSQKNADALEYFKNYSLLVNSRSYPNLVLRKMKYFSNTLDSFNPANRISHYSVVFQGVVPSATIDTQTAFAPSDFWRLNFKPMVSKQDMPVMLVSDRIEQNGSDLEDNILLVFYNKRRVWIFSIVFVLVLGLVLWQAAKEQFKVLRDDNTCTQNPANSTFSLSQTQVFVWTFVIFGMIAYQWSITGYFPKITAAHLILLGIAAGQRLIARVMDVKPPMKNQAAPSATGMPILPGGCSRGFFTDIISDSTGISVSRLQYVIVTIIFLVIFLSTGIEKLQLMDFSIEQLALMGTSAGLYLWNKKLDQ